MPGESPRFRRPIRFVADSQKVLGGMPEDVRESFGYSLMLVQYGDHPDGARPFGEGVNSDVMKLVEDDDGETYRAAYVIAFEGVVYVLDVFQKKSTSGIATPKDDLRRVKLRYQAAKRDYEKNKAEYVAAATKAAIEAGNRTEARAAKRNKTTRRKHHG